jgi:hypothetical protein
VITAAGLRQRCANDAPPVVSAPTPVLHVWLIRINSRYLDRVG